MRAPDIYWTILEKGKDKLVRLGDIAEVRRGITTGANEFFYFDNEKIREWGIENEFLIPVIKSPKECKKIRIDNTDLNFNIFICPKDKKELKGTAALEYIYWGEKKYFHKRPTCSVRLKWWSTKFKAENSIFVKEANDTSAIFYNPDFYPVDCRLYCSNLRPLQIAYLNSVIGGMLFEIYNRAGLGEGARSLMVEDYMKVPVLMNTNEALDSIKIALKDTYLLPPRKLLSPKSTDWEQIDNIVFNDLSFTQGERDAVYEAVIKLVETRLNKAKSLNPMR